MKQDPLVKDGYDTLVNNWRHFLEGRIGCLQQALSYCDSPIEQLFLISFIDSFGWELFAWDDMPRVVGCRFFLTQTPWQNERYFYRMEGQREIEVEGKNYRIDFLLFLTDRASQRVVARVAIELDGHDFHERTKEQATRDRSRDRRLMRAAIHVIRFTGSEVYRNPDKCVLEVHGFISKFLPSKDQEMVDAG